MNQHPHIIVTMTSPTSANFCTTYREPPFEVLLAMLMIKDDTKLATAELTSSEDSGIPDADMDALRELVEHYSMAGITLDADGNVATCPANTAKINNFRWVRKTVTRNELPMIHISEDDMKLLKTGLMKATKFAEENGVLPTALPAMIPEVYTSGQLQDWARTAKLQKVMGAHISGIVRNAVKQTITAIRDDKSKGGEGTIDIELSAEISNESPQKAVIESVLAILCYSDMICGLAEQIVQDEGKRLQSDQFRADLQKVAPVEAFEVAALLQSGNSDKLLLPQWNLQETEEKLKEFLSSLLSRTADLILTMACDVVEKAEQQTQGTLEA